MQHRSEVAAPVPATVGVAQPALWGGAFQLHDPWIVPKKFCNQMLQGTRPLLETEHTLVPEPTLPLTQDPAVLADLPIFKSLSERDGTSLKLNGETSLHIRKAAANPFRVSLLLMRFLGKERILQRHRLT